MKNIAIIFIGTSRYKSFFEGYYEGITKHFLKECKKDIFAFTDQVNDQIFKKENVKTVEIDHMPWPYVTLFRFKFINKISDILSKYDNLFFIDADLWNVSDVS